MRNTTILIILALLILTYSANAQQKEIDKTTSQKIEKYFKEKGEIYFKFNIFSRNELNTLTRIISIDNVRDFVVYAYANEKEFSEFKKLGYSFQLLPHPSETATGINMAQNLDEAMAWDFYPTYGQYDTMMTAFQTNYPNLCQKIDIGTTVSGIRHLYFIKITDSVNVRKPKPRFMYTSSMHGDEVTGYVLMLHLIDTLAKGYGVNPQITSLLQNVEIWINPLANPDGTYHGGNQTVTGAVRYNANNIDLNRNYPDPVQGQHPDGNAWQAETIHFMHIADSLYFMMSMNFHGGSQVLNYTWDSMQQYPPDDSYFISICKHYVDTVHALAPTYMADLLGYPNYPGVVNGYSWYSVHGGRQDYMTYFKHGKEITAEISTTKMPAGNTLPTYWTNSFKSFINYIKESLYGVRGIVTDSVTGAKLKASIYVVNHDTLNTWIYTDSVCGDYHRSLATGTYTLSFAAQGHITKTIPNVYIKIDSTTILNVQLKSSSTEISGNQSNIPADFSLYQNYPNPFNPVTEISFDLPWKTNVTLKVYDNLGREVATIINGVLDAGKHSTSWNAADFSSGVYFYKLTTDTKTLAKVMLLIK